MVVAYTEFDPNVFLALGLAILAVVAFAFAAVLRRTERRDARSLAHLDSETASCLLSIAETAHLIVARIDAEGRFAWVTPNVEAILGVRQAELVSGRATFHQFVHPDDRASLLAALRHRRQGRGDRLEFQYRLRAVDGSWRWFHERQGPVQGAGTPPQLWEIVAVDLTDRRRADEQQRQALSLQQLSTRILESFLQTALQSGGLDATIGGAIGLLGNHFGASRASYFLFDAAADQVKLVSEWIADGATSASDRRKVVPMESAKWWASAIANGSPMTLVRDDEFQRQPELAMRLKPEVQSLLCLPVMAGGSLRGALLFEDLVGPRRWRPEEIATMQTLAFAVARGLEQQDSADAGARFTALQRQLERTELVAQLTGGIAHDFNNILFAITSHVQLLRQRTSEPEVLATLKDIDRVADGARGIVSGLIHAHRGEIEQPEPRPLFHEVDAAVRLAGRLLPRGVTLETDLGAAHNCVVRSTAQGIRQLVLNLVVNARDAVGQRGTVRVSCGVETGSDLGAAAVLVVEDNGPGVPEELRQQVLQAFFTTKGDAGTGLGLAICNRVAQEAGGKMKLDRSPILGGLRVSIWFPLLSEQPRVVEDAPVEIDTDERLADVNRVLVVEDDQAIRDVLVAAFESLDIDVVARPDAEGVESILIGGPFAVDLLIMDIDLGGMSGIECLEQLRSKGVRIPCLFVTGGIQAPPATLAPCRVLRKPFPLDALVGACRSVLNDAAARAAG